MHLFSRVGGSAPHINKQHPHNLSLPKLLSLAGVAWPTQAQEQYVCWWVAARIKIYVKIHCGDACSQTHIELNNSIAIRANHYQKVTVKLTLSQNNVRQYSTSCSQCKKTRCKINVFVLCKLNTIPPQTQGDRKP